MRFIFIDSNVFFENWHLNSASFQRLGSFIPNSDAILIIPEVVCLEVQNLYTRERARLTSELKKLYDKLQRQLTTKIDYDSAAFSEAYDFKQVLREAFQFVTIISFENIPHATLVSRAMVPLMPFRDSEKGYRDSLIWLSLIDFLKDKPASDQVYFVSENTNDFYTKDKVELHKDLSLDISANGIQPIIIPFTSLHSFLDQVDTNDDSAFSQYTVREQFLDPKELEIENWLEDEINVIPLSALKQRIDPTGQLRHLRTITAFNFEIVEGVEDPLVISYRRLSDTNLFIQYSIELRTCELSLTIPADEYYAKKSGFDIFYSNAVVSGQEAYVRAYFRSAVTLSLVADIQTKMISGLELQTFALMTFR
jgi:hypothetical protein